MRKKDLCCTMMTFCHLNMPFFPSLSGAMSVRLQPYLENSLGKRGMKGQAAILRMRGTFGQYKKEVFSPQHEPYKYKL